MDWLLWVEFKLRRIFIGVCAIGVQCRVANLGWGSRALGGKVIGAIRERGQESGTRGEWVFINTS